MIETTFSERHCDVISRQVTRLRRLTWVIYIYIKRVNKIKIWEYISSLQRLLNNRDINVNNGNASYKSSSDLVGVFLNTFET